MNPNPNNEMSMEVRLALAFGLMMLVLFATPYFYKQPPVAPPAKADPASAKTKTAESPTGPQPGTQAAPVKPVEAPVANPSQVRAEAEQTFTVESNYYRIVFSNRGAVVKSWILKKYLDSTGKPVELVNELAAPKAGYPLGLAFKAQKPAFDPNQVLFVGHQTDDKLGIDFEFSDGQTVVRKGLRFKKDSYLASLTTEVATSGINLPHWIMWRGGFGDPSAANKDLIQHSTFYDPSVPFALWGKSKLTVKAAKEAKDGPVSEIGVFSFAGLEDSYFAGVFLPRDNAQLEITTYDDMVPVSADKDAKEEARVGAAVGGDGRHQFELFIGPKDIDLLRTVNPKLEQLVDWGWFGIIAKPLFLVLNYVNDQYIHNYGWSIISLTIAINLLLLPLRFTSLKSSRQMAAMQPEIQAINAKYKNIKLNDPKKNDQNEELMALYKKHGVNPLGGCLPLLVQMPFLLAFYKVLAVTIEMRGAHWLWVTDLSRPEDLPIRVLPVILVLTQFITQQMTPTPGMDPSQAMMMKVMPLVFGYMFYYQSAGLVLYWLTGNFVGIIQQWFINKMMPAPPVAPAAKVKKS